jgi:hypothetical protein
MEIILTGSITGTKTVNTNCLISRSKIDDEDNTRHFIQFVMVDNIQMEAFFETETARNTAFDAITTAIENLEKTITINVL